MSRIVKLPPFENVGAGLRALMPRIPTGPVYEMILLKLGGTTFAKSHIEQIKMYLAGKTIMDISGSHLDAINQYLGMTANAAYLPIYFSEPDARTIVGEDQGALDTSLGYSAFNMEVSISSSASAPTLEAWAIQKNSKVDQKTRRLFRALIKSTHNKAASGKYNLPIALGSDRGGLIKRIHMFDATGDLSNISQFDVKRNGLDILEEGEKNVIQYLQDELTRVTQTGHLCWDPLWRDNQSKSVPTTNRTSDGERPANFEFNMTLDGAETVTAYAEMYTDINRV